MRSTATSGKWDGTSAGTALPGWWALDSAVGDVRPVSFGVASASAGPWSGNHVCAPPLLKRIVVVGGTCMMLRGGVQGGRWRTRRRAWSADSRIAALLQRFQPGCSGRGGGLGCQGTDQQRLKTSTRRGGRESSRHIDAFRAVRCCSSLMRATSGHPAARLLQPCLRRQCKPAPAAGGAHRRLMGPTSSTPGPTGTPRS